MVSARNARLSLNRPASGWVWRAWFVLLIEVSRRALQGFHLVLAVRRVNTFSEFAF